MFASNYVIFEKNELMGFLFHLIFKISTLLKMIRCGEDLADTSAVDVSAHEITKERRRGTDLSPLLNFSQKYQIIEGTCQTNANLQLQTWTARLAHVLPGRHRELRVERSSSRRRLLQEKCFPSR